MNNTSSCKIDIQPVMDLSGEVSSQQVISRTHQEEGDDRPPHYVLWDTLSPTRLHGDARLLLAYPATQQAECLVAAPIPVVVKAVRKPGPLVRKKGTCDAVRELAVMKEVTKCSIPHSIHLLDSLQDDSFVYMILPHLGGGDLFQRVEASGGVGLGEEQTKALFRPVIEALLALKQQCRLAHHDLSLENVMVDGEGAVKLIDFGLSIKEEGGKHMYSGKPGYVAPEVARRKRPIDVYAADIWSLGVCLYIALTGLPLYRKPFDKLFLQLESGNITQIIAGDEKQHERYLSSPAKCMLTQMLQPEPSKRPTLEELLAHPFFTGAPGKPRSKWNLCPCFRWVCK